MTVDRSLLIRASVGAAICAALAACGGSDQDQARMQAAVDSVTKADTLSVGGEVSGGSAMSDANVVSVLATANAAEVTEGQMAQRRSRNGDVKDFAKTLVNDHQDFQKEIDEAAKQAGITPQPPSAADSLKHAASQAADSLEHLSGAAFDRAWVAHEVAGHQKTLADLQRMQSTVRNQQLRDAIGDGIGKVREHLEKAQQLQAKLGTS